MSILVPLAPSWILSAATGVAGALGLGGAGAILTAPVATTTNVAVPNVAVQGAPAGDTSRAVLEALPPQTIGILGIWNVDALRARMEKSSWGKFLRHPEVEAYVRESLQGVFPDAAELRAGATGEDADLDPLQVLESIHGSAAAFTLAVGPGNELGLGLIVHPGAERGAFEEVFDQVVAKIAAESVESSSSFQDVELRLFESPDAGEDSAAMVDHLVVFEVGELFAIVGAEGLDNTMLVAHGVIERTKGADSSLGMGDNAMLAEARAQAGGPGAFEVFLDLGQVARLAMEEEGIDATNPIAQGFGLADFRWMHMNADLGEGEKLDFNVAAAFPERGFLNAFLGLFQALPEKLLRLTPKECSSMTAGTFDLAGMYDLAMETFQQMSPEEYETARMMIDGAIDTYGLDFEEELLRQLTGGISTFTTTIPPEETLDGALGLPFGGAVGPTGTPEGNAMLVGVHDAEMVQYFLDDAFALAESALGMPIAQMIETTEFQGQQVQTLQTPMGISLHWAFTKDAWVLSFYPSALRSVLRLVGKEDAPNVMTDERFLQAMRAAPGASLLGFADTRQSVAAMMAAVEAAGTAIESAEEGGGLGEGMEAQIFADASEAQQQWLRSPAVRENFKGMMGSAIRRNGRVLRFHLFAR